MAVPPPAHARLIDRAFLLGVPITAATMLLLGAAGRLSAPIALALGVGGAGCWAAARLVRAALRIHHADGTFVACKGAGFIGMAALATALTAFVPSWVPPQPGVWVTAGFTTTALLYAVGTSLLPGSATDRAIRFRRAFDGLGLGVSLAFAGYVIPVSRDGRVAQLSMLPIVVIGAAAVAMVTITVLRGRPPRPAAIRCGFGAIAVLAGLGTLTALLLVGSAEPLAGLPIVLGLAVTAEGGARRELPPPELAPRHPDQYLASYPLLAIPAGVGVVAAGWHLVTVHQFDTTAIILGLSVVAVLALRELLVVRDIRRYAGRLKVAEAHFRSLVAGATDLTLMLDERLRVEWLSAPLFGLTDAAVLGRAFVQLIHPDDAPLAQATIDAVLAGDYADGPPALVSARLLDGNQLWRDTESTFADQRAVPEVAALVVHVRDVGERRHLERTLHRLSYSDQLTGLGNRRALMRDLVAYRRRPGRQGTLLVIDLHGLAEINDTRGRATGDAVLTEVGRRIRSLLADDDVAARLGGVEFAVLTADSAVLAYALAIRLVTVLTEPYDLPHNLVELHTSVGLAELAGGADSDEVLRHADLARKRARQLGFDRVEWYDPDVELQLNRRMELEQQLLGAISRSELDLVFQPVVDLRDQKPVGVEALLRWRHPQLGTIMPAELFPIARAVGLAAQIDEWVLDAACKHLTGWQSGGDDLWLSVNVTPRELLTARYPDRVASTLARHGLPAERLVVEVAETWIAEDVPAIVAALAGLRKLGVRAALDDFGAGQASLSHLRRLPVDLLKLNAALVDSGGDAPASHGPAVIDVVVSLGRRLGLQTVAKGLETTEQIERASRAGCSYGQGFALARPAPAERIEAYLDSHRPAV